MRGPISCRFHRSQKFSIRLVRRSSFIIANVFSHCSTDLSHLSAISGVCGRLRWAILCFCRRLLGSVFGCWQFCSGISRLVSCIQKWVLSSLFLLYFAPLDSKGGAGVGMLGFLTDLLWTLSVDKVFTTLGNFSLMTLLLVGTCMLFITSFPVYAPSRVSSALLSPVQMVVEPLLRSPLAIHGGLVISLLEWIASGLSVSSEDGNSNSDGVEFSRMVHVDVLQLDVFWRFQSSAWPGNRSALSFRPMYIPRSGFAIALCCDRTTSGSE